MDLYDIGMKHFAGDNVNFLKSIMGELTPNVRQPTYPVLLHQLFGFPINQVKVSCHSFRLFSS